MVAQLVSLRVSDIGNLRVARDVLTNHEERGFDSVPVKDFKNLACVERVRTVVKRKCHYFLGRFDPVIGFTEELAIKHFERIPELTP